MENSPEIYSGALIHCIRNGALSQATTTKDPLFLSSATSKESAEKTQMLVEMPIQKSPEALWK